MFYLPRSRPRRESEWRTHLPNEMPNSAQPKVASERVRVQPGLAPDTLLVTGYTLDGRPVTRMEIPATWFTPEWARWMETRCAREDGAATPQLKLIG